MNTHFEMYTFGVILFVIININNILCIPCEVGDVQDNTKGANRNFLFFINGIENRVPTSDPLYSELITADLPDIKYVFEKAYLTGMRNCTVENLNICKGEGTFSYGLLCPRIYLKADYKVEGKVGTQLIEGQGVADIERDDYKFMFTGAYKKFEGEDGQTHIRVTDFDFSTDAGKVNFDLKNLFGGDQQKTAEVNKYLNENWKSLDKTLAGPTLQNFMDHFIGNLNLFLKDVPLKTAFGL